MTGALEIINRSMEVSSRGRLEWIDDEKPRIIKLQLT